MLIERPAANSDLVRRNAQRLFGAVLAHYPANKSQALGCQKETLLLLSVVIINLESPFCRV